MWVRFGRESGQISKTAKCVSCFLKSTCVDKTRIPLSSTRKAACKFTSGFFRALTLYCQPLTSTTQAIWGGRNFLRFRCGLAPAGSTKRDGVRQDKLDWKEHSMPANWNRFRLPFPP
ncbi:hypothetical protein Pla52o_50290 [Novipirellula galeiformis]|uniref:Uncharacterized protein n=1 Tax=Novipirellula galeiformis TaxID=2528004 RepID=A0A5C6C2K0_9BACT|nr:hypothetical protein Pla52o_50290 [Novipirellula galeiformis]